MSIKTRIAGYRHHQSLSGALTYLLGFLGAAWFAPRPITLSVLLILSVMVAAGVYLGRHAILNRYPKVIRLLNRASPVVLLAIFASYLLGVFEAAVVILGLYSVVLLSLPLFCATDPMCEMITWLRYPTEWGRWPDEIEEIDARRIPWPGKQGQVDCRLYRYRYGDVWETGLTGPITFSLGEQDFEGKPPEAIYAVYANWYEAETPAGRLARGTKRS